MRFFGWAFFSKYIDYDEFLWSYGEQDHRMSWFESYNELLGNIIKT